MTEKKTPEETALLKRQHEELSTIMKAAYDKGDAMEAILRRVNPKELSYGQPMGSHQQKMFASDEILDAAYAKYKPAA